MTAVIAHRGASRSRRQNTVEAFAHAVEVGADWIELDVRRTADGVLVIHHDAHLPDGRTLVSTAAADLPEWVPTLAEALEAAEGASVNIEIKNDPAEPDYDAEHQISLAVAGMALAYRPAGELLVTSFNVEAVNRVRACEPALPTGLLTSELFDLDQWIERLVAGGHRTFLPWLALVDRRLVERAHGRDVLVYVWTVNEADDMRRLVDLGVDGIISDDPALARSIVDGMGAGTE